MSNNKNNFLRFTGADTTPGFTITPVTAAFTFYASDDFIVITPLAGCSASLGIDPLSFEITSIEDGFGHEITMSRDCFWDGISNLTVYRPNNAALPFFIIKFGFYDYGGNYSGGLTQDVINMSTITTEWVAYPISSFCTLDSFGNNTGYLAWTQLKLINAITTTDVIPLTLKANAPSDPDYIAPVTNYITCPVVGIGTYSPLVISNFSQNGSDPGNYITITNIYLASTNLGPGSTPIALNIPCNIAPGQTRRFNVPSGVWDTGLTITYTVNGNMVTCVPTRYWMANVGGVLTGWNSGGITSDPVTNAGIYGSFTITIPPASSGITIFAQ